MNFYTYGVKDEKFLKTNELFRHVQTKTNHCVSFLGGTSLTDGATVAIVNVDISPELSEKQEAAVCISGNEELWSQNILL